jgi:CO/xanthine dehydrogenase Mo-binding subunit
VSALRSLGAFANVFAIESFMDELAAAASIDPVAFRLRHLSDERARAVVESAARAVDWPTPIARRDDGLARGRGFAFARYKNQAAYTAVVAEVAVDRASGTIRVERMTAAVDAGDVINPDGLRNQIEGGMAQAASWTLHEEVRFDRDRVASVDWRSYPIARFPEAPVVTVEVLERPDDPPVGAGEAAQGPAAAAIANALFAATRARLRDLPLRPERVRAALEAAPSAAGR